MGPTISSSPRKGNLPAQRVSFSDGSLDMMLLFPASPSVVCFSVANGSDELSTVLAIVISLLFFHLSSVAAHLS